jgi:transposase InsO family protein
MTRRGFITPQPHKRPRSAWKRFEAAQPNECWQADVTHWHLADGTQIEILNILDDHSRLAITSLVRPTVSGPDVELRGLRQKRHKDEIRWSVPSYTLSPSDHGEVRKRAHRNRFAEIAASARQEM